MVKRIEIEGMIISNELQEAYDYYGVLATSPNKVLSQLPEDRNEELELIINSGGGSVSAGRDLYAKLNEYPGTVTAKITGLSASIASVFSLASDKVLISRIGQIMIHNASVGGHIQGDNSDFQKVADMLESTNEALANAYVAKTGKTKDEILELMKNETWFTAEKAIEFGLADGILEDEQSPSTGVMNTSLGLVASSYIMNVLPEKAIEEFNNMKALEIENKNKLKLTAQLELLKIKGDY